jgi:sugar-phosphatase
MPEVGALLLDLDGTLVDSEDFHRQTFRTWFTARGWAVDEAVLDTFTGRRADDVLAAEPGPWAGEDVSVLLAEILAHADGLPRPALAEGAAELLTRAALPLALVTSADTAWARTCLGDLLDRFAVVVTRDEVRAGKPHPEPYRLAVSTLGVPAHRCLAVEDAPAGITSALGAGIGTVVAVTSTFGAADLAAAHVVVSSLDEVRALL